MQLKHSMRCWKLAIILTILCGWLPDVCLSRTESEARTQCIAQCLKTFKSEVSPSLGRILRQHPARINKECGSNSDSPTDGQAAAACSQCTHTCNHYGTAAAASSSGPSDSSISRNCQHFCQTSELAVRPTCLTSCAVISRLLVTNQGECPNLAAASGGTGAGADGEDAIVCRSAGAPCPGVGDDRACTGGLRPARCCPNACGFACTAANITEEALPLTPAAPAMNRPDADSSVILLNPGHKRAIRVEWSRYNLTVHPDPIVFLLQVRGHLSSHFDSVAMATSRWADVAVTTRKNLLVEEMDVGAWYQFRLAAVSSAGFRAYSEASDPVKTGEPERPRQVRELQEGVSRIHDGVVDVQIVWKSPTASDLPVAKYEIKWVEMIGIDKEALTVFNTSVPVKQTEFTLPKLKLGATYRVSVAAVANYGSRLELWSRLSTIYVTTMRLAEPAAPPSQTQTVAPPIPEKKVLDSDRPSSSSSDAAATPSRLLEADSSQPAHTLDCSCFERPKTPLTTNQPYYDSGDLKLLLFWPSPTYGAAQQQQQQVNTYVIKWSQRVCIESGPTAGEIPTRQAVVHNSLMFNIGSLKFNCHYALQLRGLTNSGDVAFTWNTCFCTRSCKETQIRGNRFPSCPRDEVASAPQPPAKLRFNILRLARDPTVGSELFAARISWAAPDHTAMHAISGFRLTWGPAEDEGGAAYPPAGQSAGVLGGGGSSSGLEPRMDPERSDTSVVDMREREFHLYNLRPGTLYIVAMQTMTVFGDSRPAKLTFATPDSKSTSSSSMSNSEVQKYINNEYSNSNANYNSKNGAGAARRTLVGTAILTAVLVTATTLLRTLADTT